MAAINVLLLSGGGSAEHDVSLVSAKFLSQQLSELPDISLYQVEITKNNEWRDKNGQLCRFNLDKTLTIGNDSIQLDYAIPCIHGFPGETGDIQSLFELANLPYMGCSSAASILCFNKISSKLWFDALGIPNTPYVFLTENNAQSMAQAEQAFDNWGALFVKAACQGSSVGCYKVTDKQQLAGAVQQAFSYSEQVLVEKAVRPRELEIAAYHYDGEIVITEPGEILCADETFYSFDEKYSADSQASTTLTPTNLSAQQIALMQAYAKKAFVHMQLKDLSRIDFFLTDENEILLNEINTFPGMTPISMFPKLLQHHGHQVPAYLLSCIKQALK